MSGLIEKIEHAMHHGEKTKNAATAEDDVPKFGSGHIEKASGGYYDAGADLHSAPVHEENAKPGKAEYDSDLKTGGGSKSGQHHGSSDETGAGRRDEQLESGRTGAQGGPATASNKDTYESSGTSSSSTTTGTSHAHQQQQSSGSSLSSGTLPVSSSSTTTTTYSGYEVGSSQPVGQVLPGPADIQEIRQEVEAAEYGSTGLTGAGSGVGHGAGSTGHSTGL